MFFTLFYHNITCSLFLPNIIFWMYQLTNSLRSSIRLHYLNNNVLVEPLNTLTDLSLYILKLINNLVTKEFIIPSYQLCIYFIPCIYNPLGIDLAIVCKWVFILIIQRCNHLTVVVIPEITFKTFSRGFIYWLGFRSYTSCHDLNLTEVIYLVCVPLYKHFRF